MLLRLILLSFFSIFWGLSGKSSGCLRDFPDVLLGGPLDVDLSFLFIVGVIEFSWIPTLTLNDTNF
jgi:hypothetical protein